MKSGEVYSYSIDDGSICLPTLLEIIIEVGIEITVYEYEEGYYSYFPKDMCPAILLTSIFVGELCE